jgi:prolyl-tRNA synthetase
MRVSQLLTTTLREAPRDVEGASYSLLVRAGFVRQLCQGIYSFLPLGLRVIHKIECIVHEEMGRIGAQEVAMPILQPAELREHRLADNGLAGLQRRGATLFRLTDRKERAFVPGPTHEEVATLLAREFVRSYRDLPRLLYQIQIRFRDELRPHAGLLHAREFFMHELYSFDADELGLDASYRRVSDAYAAIFTRCGLHYKVVQADSGAAGSRDAHAFLAIADNGEELALLCNNCGYAAHIDKAVFVRSELERTPAAALEEVYTPHCTTISDLAAFLQIPAAQTMKAVCYHAAGRLVLAAVRGDLEVNEVKLANVLKQASVDAADLHLATPEELAQAGIVAGYTSPLGKDQNILIVADDALKQGSNFVAGANRAGYHIKNVNYPRDFRVDIWQDIASAYDGAICCYCGGALHAIHGYQSGYTFKAGTTYSVPFDATYLTSDGVMQPLLMGYYGIDISHFMAAIVEQSYDANGMCWPFAVAPYHVMLVGLDLDRDEIRLEAERLCADLQAAGIEVLFDDRRESAGVKFNDADLLGLPLRAVISRRSLKRGGIELTARAHKESRNVALVDALSTIKEEVDRGLASVRSYRG